MLRAGRIRRDERQIDIRLAHAGEFDLRLLRRLDETLCTHLVLREVDAVCLLELLDHPVHDLLVEVVAAENRVAVRRLNLKDALTEFEDGYVERTAAKVKDENRLILILVEAVGECCSCRLIDDAQNLEACNLARVLRCLTLTVVEICRNSNDCLRDCLAEVCLRIALEFLQDHRRDLGRRVVLAVNRYMIVWITHMPLDGRDCAVRVRDCLVLCKAANEALPVLRKAHDRRRDAAALRIRDNCGLAALHDGDNGVRRSKINTNYFSHFIFLQNTFKLLYA